MAPSALMKLAALSLNKEGHRVVSLVTFGARAAPRSWREMTLHLTGALSLGAGEGADTERPRLFTMKGLVT